MNCVSATMCTTAAMPRLLEPCCKKENVTLFLLAALRGKRRVWMKWRQICDYHVLIELITSASVSQQTRRPVGAAESKCQMRSCLCLGAATLQSFLLNTFHQRCFYVHFKKKQDFIKIARIETLHVCCNFPVCPSVPETLNLWGQSRSQVRSSGTGLHSVSTS